MSSDVPLLPGFAAARLVDPFEIYVGPVFEAGAAGARTYAIRLDERHMNRRGVVHGGMLMTLADLTLGQAVWDATERAACATLNMQCHFVRSAVAGDIVQVVPQVVRRTRALVFMRGDFTVARETVFTASSVWKMLGEE